VQVSGVAEGAALGAAFLARMAVGAESALTDAARWAAVERVVEPSPAWVGPVAERYRRFIELASLG
jgi:xylulokinase